MFRALLLLITVSLLPAAAQAAWTSKAPQAWEIWRANNPANTTPIDHSVWDNILQTYVQRDTAGLNRFVYSRVSDADKATLDSYIKGLTQIKITDRSPDVQLAYWINLYNAVTISLVLDHYPVKSIRDINISGLLSYGPWGKELVTVEGEELSLDAIEHEILRPIWKDARIHYAVNCASIGCPNLHERAFTAENVDELLTNLATDYINNPRGVNVEDGEVTVSKIYKWFAYDFGNSQENILIHLATYARPELKADLKRIGRITDSRYNWLLNE